MSRLNCNSGNYQCGGKCQPNSYECQIDSHSRSVNKTLSNAARQAAKKYENGDLLGEGAYGKVYASTDGKHVIKEAKDEKHDFSNEIAYYNKAHSLGVSPKAEPGLRPNQMILTKVRGKTLKEQSKTLTESDAKSILQARRKLHENGIVHNDLHYENIMKDESGNWNIIDFGSAGPSNAADMITELGDSSEFLLGGFFERNPRSELTQRYLKLEQDMENMVRKRGEGSMRKGYQSFTDAEIRGLVKKYYRYLFDEQK